MRHYKPALHCHPERSEGSPVSTHESSGQREILRSTQDDIRAAKDDIRAAKDDRREVLFSWRVNVPVRFEKRLRIAPKKLFCARSSVAERLYAAPISGFVAQGNAGVVRAGAGVRAPWHHPGDVVRQSEAFPRAAYLFPAGR